jgi:hypothetical protein
VTYVRDCCDQRDGPVPGMWPDAHHQINLVLPQRRNGSGSKTYSLNADLCKTCIHRRFWQFQGKNLLLGPWGTFSLVVTPIYLLQNTAVYLSTLYKLRDAVE